MSEFNKDDYLNDLPDAENLDGSRASGPAGDDSADRDAQEREGAAAQDASPAKNEGSGPSVPAASSQPGAESGATEACEDGKVDESQEDTLTPLGQAKKEAAEYLDALQRERAEFINYRNRSAKEQQRFREHGIIDVLTALLPALDDIDRIREHGEMSDSFKAVAGKFDKVFEKFGVEKFGAKGEGFDPAKHDAVLHKQDPAASKETIDTVVEAGYRIGDRVIRAARVVVASPKN